MHNLGKLLGLNKIRTTEYHPQADGMVERTHRTLKSAQMCTKIPWLKMLPSALLGLCTVYKPYLGSSTAEMLYEATIRVSGDCFTLQEQPANTRTFVEKIRAHFAALQVSRSKVGPRCPARYKAGLHRLSGLRMARVSHHDLKLACPDFNNSELAHIAHLGVKLAQTKNSGLKVAHAA